MRKLDRPIPGVGPNDTVLVLSVFEGEDEDWNGTVVLGRVDGEDDITRLAGEAIEDRPQEDCTLAFEVSPPELSDSESAWPPPREDLDDEFGDPLEDLLRKDLYDVEYPDHNYSKWDPCSLDCNTHHNYMVVRGDDVISTWYPVEHRSSHGRDASMARGVIVEHSGGWCCESQDCHENYLSTPEEIKAALVKAGFVSGSPARDENKGRVAMRGVRRRDGKDNGIDTTDGLY